ncbi:MAG: hypothetical protein KGO96_13885 [Elusimicrobia bacterium]|nr:hypothetical protein [Elusimicrobiota bacterium]MDE2426984.1 hypothetical protein [Elusimicrobiota bacterium]
MTSILGGLAGTAKWAVAWVLVWGALLTLASTDSLATLAVGLAWLIFFGAFLTQGVKALQQLGV